MPEFDVAGGQRPEEERTLLNRFFDALKFKSPIVNPDRLGQAEPPAAFLRDGMVAYADGINWSPGGGKVGFYRYDTTLATWLPYVAEVWEEIPPAALIKAKAGGSGVPSLTALQGDIKQYTFSLGDYLYSVSEIIHGYKEGADIDVHVHWVTQSSDGTDRGVKWKLKYTMANADFTAPFTEAFPAVTQISIDTTIPANTAAKSHIVSSLGTISGTGKKIDAYIVFEIRRIASAETAPSSDPYGIAVGFHTIFNTDGSRQIGTK